VNWFRHRNYVMYTVYHRESHHMYIVLTVFRKEYLTYLLAELLEENMNQCESFK